MSFSDLFFLYFFLPVCLLFYYLTKNIEWRNAVLLIFSLIFYAWGEPVFVLLIIFSAFVNYCIAIEAEKRRNTKSGKLLAALALIYDIGVLVLFKYTGFIIENINAVLSTAIPVPKLGLPLGLSFYTFQIISYILDVWWEKTDAEKYFSDFLLYVSLFPNVTCGPIVRYSDISSSLSNRVSNVSDISHGISRIIVGLAKKAIIADSLAKITEAFLGRDIPGSSFLGCWYGIVIYSLQVYFDFSGYSDIAIGLARLFGFEYRENFNYPFVSKTITEFWQRWHISLGTFFRDYLLYVPIFGKQRRFGGLFLVWLFTGLWHGASWNYIIWGLYFGMFILFETLLGKKRLKKIPKLFLHIYSKLVIAVGFGIFYCTDLSKLGKLMRGLTGTAGLPFCDELLLHSFANNIFIISAAVILSTPLFEKLKNKLSKTESGTLLCGTARIVLNAALLLVSSLILVNATDNPFLYVSF